MNLKINNTIFRICNYLKSLIEDYKEYLSYNRISNLRLINITFFWLFL